MDQRYDLFTGTITALYQIVQKIRAHEMERFGLQTGHSSCLYHLLRNPDGLTQKELVRLCEMDKAAVSRYVARLKERRLVREDGSPDKKYNLRIVLTEEGKQAAEEIQSRIRQAVVSCSADMSAPERDWFYKKMQQIADNLSAYYQTLEKKEDLL